MHYGRVCKLLYEEVKELSAISSRLDPETLKELEIIERREWAEEFKRVIKEILFNVYITIFTRLWWKSRTIPLN